MDGSEKVGKKKMESEENLGEEKNGVQRWELRGWHCCASGQ